MLTVSFVCKNQWNLRPVFVPFYLTLHILQYSQVQQHPFIGYNIHIKYCSIPS